MLSRTGTWAVAVSWDRMAPATTASSVSANLTRPAIPILILIIIVIIIIIVIVI
jgi:hypothetical protein